MRIIKCDLCDAKIEVDAIKVEVLDGEHPHNGSTMTKTIDVCPSCASRMELRCDKEFVELRRKQ